MYLVGVTIRRPVIAGGFALILILLMVILLPRLPSGFLPDMDEGAIVMDYKSPSGSSLEATNTMLKIVDSILSQTPEVDSFSRRTGTQMGFFITEPNDGNYLIQLKKKRSKTTDQVLDDIRIKIEAMLPSLKVDFGQVIGDMLGDLMASVQPIEVKIFGDDHGKLAELADSVSVLVEETRGTADVFNGITIAGPEIRFNPKIATLSPDDFQFQMQTKIEGHVVGSILEKNQVTDIRMLENDQGASTYDLQHATLYLNDGRLKPIGEFADRMITKGVAEIECENLKPMVAVTARLNSRDLGSTLREIQETIKSRIMLPPGYQIEYGGAYAEQQQAFRELLGILISAVMLVFIVILFLFRSIKVAITIMSIAVLGISESVLALFITSMPLNVGSYTGIIMIVGIIGENAIFTYQQYLEERKKQHGKDNALIDAISKRLRPNLMTALGAICALAPLALGLGAGAQMHQPLAIAIIGGFVVTLPLLLIVLSSMLRLIEK